MRAFFRYSTMIAVIVLSLLTLATGDVARSATVDQESNSSFSASHIVMFEKGTDTDQLLAELVSEYGVSVGFIYRHALNGASLFIPEGFEDDVLAHPGVTHLETNGKVEFQAFPDDVQMVPTGLQRAGIDEQHPLFDIDGSGPDTDVDIAIIDTGVDSTHPDLNVYAAADCAENGSACVEIADLSLTPSTDELGHGTRSAGVAAAMDNGFGIVGSAPGARIWSVKLDVPGNNDNLDSLIAAIAWTTSHADEIDVASMSLISTGSNSLALRQAVQGAVSAGIVVFAAAGNQGNEIYGPNGALDGIDDIEPASFPEVATISGYTDTDGIPGGLGPDYEPGFAPNNDEDDTFWTGGTNSASNFNASVDGSNPVISAGGAIDFAMPATDVMTTCIVTAFFTCDITAAGGEKYTPSDGTSIATPQAAGLAALMIARNGSREFDGVPGISQDDVYALRQMLIDLATPQDDPVYGLLQPSDDPDGNPDPLGSARMVLDFDQSLLTLPDITSSQLVTVSTPFIPIGVAGDPENAPVDSVQITLLHDDALTTIQNPTCTGVYAGGTVFGPVRNGADTGTIIGCSLLSGVLSANSGPVMTFDIQRSGNGGADLTFETTGAFGTGFLVGGAQIPHAPLGSFRVFGATITGSYGLQAVTLEAELANIGPVPKAIPVSGLSTVAVPGQYDAASGTFTIDVNAPGDYDVQAEATGFLPMRYQFITIVDDASSVPVPTSTTLHGGELVVDGVVDGADLSAFITSFTNATAVGDINGDTFVSALDLSILISNYGLAPPGGFEVWPAP